MNKTLFSIKVMINGLFSVKVIIERLCYLKVIIRDYLQQDHDQKIFADCLSNKFTHIFTRMILSLWIWNNKTQLYLVRNIERLYKCAQ